VVEAREWLDWGLGEDQGYGGDDSAEEKSADAILEDANETMRAPTSVRSKPPTLWRAAER
jgi:hypothetical protein